MAKNTKSHLDKKSGKAAKMKELKREEALKRLEAWNKLSAQEKVNVLDARLGKGLGAKKQRKLLQGE